MSTPFFQSCTPEERAPYFAMVEKALALPVGDPFRQSELARLCRVGAYVPRPKDWPEFSDEMWRDGVFYLRGRSRDLAVGQKVCADAENYAQLYEIDQLTEHEVEADDYEETGKMVWTTKIHVRAVEIRGSYDVIPNRDTEDILGRIIWARSRAEDTIRRTY